MLELSDVERSDLQALARRRKTAQAAALRARIVLACAEGIENNTVAERLQVTKQTVSKWRGRFVRDRLDGLLDGCICTAACGADQFDCLPSC